jgi:GNAT superfamily N-acetyltransferase
VWGRLGLEAQAAYLTALSHAGETRSRDGLLAVRTGARSNTENGVVADDATEDEIAGLLAWLDGLPASWIARRPAPGLADRLVRAGCRPERGGTDMGARLDRVRVPPGPDDVAVEAVDASTAGDWLDVAEACGWIEDTSDREARRRVLLATGDGLAAYVARRSRRPVGMARALYAPPLAAFLDVAVLEAERRRGVGRALVGARVAEARRRGCEVAVLAPSPDGCALYRTLGFELAPSPPDRWFFLPVRLDAP